MRDAAGQLADGLHLAGLEQLLAGAVEHLLRLALGRDIAGDLGEADQPAGIVADRLDDEARRETAAVLAHPQAVRLDLALFGRLAQRLRRHIGTPVFLGIEAGEMSSDDFAGLIALDPFGATVPGGDQPLGVEPVDRTVGDRLHKHLELLFGSLQFLLDRVASRDVAHAADKRGAAGQVDRRDPQFDRKLGAAAVQRRQLEAPADISPLAGLQKPLQSREMRRAIPFGDDQLGQCAADNLGMRPAEQFGRALIPLADRAVTLHDHDGIERGVQQ